MIKIENIKKSFGDKVLFDNLNLEFELGEMIAITGKSGSGKSTLLNIMGLLESYDGHIEIMGIDDPKINSKQGRKLLREQIGFIFQNYALIDYLTVRQNLELVKKFNNSNMKYDEALEKTGTLDLIDKKVSQLSGGEQQRIAISRLLIKNPMIILADEPTGNLDEANSEKVVKLLKELSRLGKLVIIVTHEDSVAKECDREIKLGDII